MKSTSYIASPGRRVIAVLVLMHLLVVMAMAASQKLHHWVHQDSDHDDDCAVVLFMHGQYDGPPAVAALLTRVLDVQPAPEPASRRVAWVQSIFAGNRVFEHGPPALG